MSEPKTPDPTPERDSKDEEALRALLKRAVSAPGASAPLPDLVRGVQRRIRQRSRGKFFKDGWSTTSTRLNYAVVALVMLLVLGIAYFALAWISVR